MKKSVLRYGLFGSITICVLFLFSWFAFKDADMSTQEVLGYASMIISLSFVYFGIKHFRDKENQGKVTFKKGLTIGIVISLITALAFGVLDLIYVKFINPDFLTEYYEVILNEMEETLPPEEFKLEQAKMEAEKQFFADPMMNFLIMFLTVFIIGFIISLISSLILQRKN
ncbi:DUF4199 domain-containing protein [Ulvibacterium sp.]|uniref:DUF4199 domain-containing protein n=1 Tax=Ulvibacterium sp. TaxID=2665914 RepID=UPI0026326DBB|nr:DUF4199 domain-containing protein [Ulvibacterium sp.]